MHPNAGARLRSEILLLSPDHVVTKGDNSLDDQHINLPVNLPNGFNNSCGDSSLLQVPDTYDITVGSSDTSHAMILSQFLRPDQRLSSRLGLRQTPRPPRQAGPAASRPCPFPPR
jgi:hypothetical protein